MDVLGTSHNSDVANMIGTIAGHVGYDPEEPVAIDEVFRGERSASAELERQLRGREKGKTLTREVEKASFASRKRTKPCPNPPRPSRRMEAAIASQN